MKPQEIVSRIELVLGYSGSPIRIQGLVETQLQEHFGLPPIKAAEEAERLENHVRRLIQANAAHHEKNGTIPTVVLSSFSERSVMGSCFVEVDDSPELVEAKLRRLQIGNLYEKMKSLTFNEFEEFGAKVLKELGASTVNVTPRTNDQGIDFYGVLSVGETAQIPKGLLSFDIKMSGVRSL